MNQQMIEKSTPISPRNLTQFQKELDDVFHRATSRIGKEDVRHIQLVARSSLALEVGGRFLLYLAWEPVTFLVSVVMIAMHKQLELMEMGHSIQHSVYENIPGAEKFRKKAHWWRFHQRIPVRDASWRNSHNRLHHGFTNIVGRDPDARLYMRLDSRRPQRWYQRYFMVEVLFNWPNIIFNAGAAAAGLFEAIAGKEGDLEILPDRSWRSRLLAIRRTIQGCGIYFLREYVFFPLIAGPQFAKILLGNWLSSILRNLFSAPVLYAGHISPEVVIFPRDKKPANRAEWYAMQVVSSQNFEVPLVAAVFMGHLNYQIEHHLFPTLPTNRLREIAPEVRAICEKHGITYNSNSWHETLRLIFVQLSNLSRPRGKVS